MNGIIKITGRQIAAARALVRIEQTDLAKAANISVPALRRMEASGGPAVGMANNIAAVRAALEIGWRDFRRRKGGRPWRAAAEGRDEGHACDNPGFLDE